MAKGEQLVEGRCRIVETGMWDQEGAQVGRGVWSPSGTERKSSITGPDGAKMSTTHGVIQGYNGVAVVGGHHQIAKHSREVHGSRRLGHRRDRRRRRTIRGDAGSIGRRLIVL
jgi:hypothetical protein